MNDPCPNCQNFDATEIIPVATYTVTIDWPPAGFACPEMIDQFVADCFSRGLFVYMPRAI
jgi:hypothetical protein